MVSLEGFNANNIEPNTARTPLPAGKYTVVIESSEQKPTKAGDGHYLQLVLQVVEGEHKGRKLFDILNMWNKSEQAKQIALGTMSSICRAVNVLTPKDSSELHNKPLVAVVGCRKYQEQIQNEVKGYEPTSGADQNGYAEAVDPNDKQASSDELNAQAPWS